VATGRVGGGAWRAIRSVGLANVSQAMDRSLYARLADKTRSARVDDRRTVVNTMHSCRRPVRWCRCVRSFGLPGVMFAPVGERSSSK